MLVLETDADMAPAMYPGVRNSPEHLPEIATALARIDGLDVEVLAEPARILHVVRLVKLG